MRTFWGHASVDVTPECLDEELEDAGSGFGSITSYLSFVSLRTEQLSYSQQCCDSLVFGSFRRHRYFMSDLKGPRCGRNEPAGVEV